MRKKIQKIQGGAPRSEKEGGSREERAASSPGGRVREEEDMSGDSPLEISAHTLLESLEVGTRPVLGTSRRQERNSFLLGEEKKPSPEVQARLYRRRLEVLRGFVTASGERYAHVPQTVSKALSELLKTGFQTSFPDLGQHLESLKYYTDPEAQVYFLEKLSALLDSVQERTAEAREKHLQGGQKVTGRGSLGPSSSHANPSGSHRSESLRTRAASSGRVHVRL